MRPWTKKLRSGRKRCMMNMTTLQSRMNMPRTEMAMLNVVVLVGSVRLVGHMYLVYVCTLSLE
jgi:hypothetical protein